MSVRIRREKRIARKPEIRARFAAWLADRDAPDAPIFGKGIPEGMFAWALRDRKGSDVALAFASTQSALDWTRQGIAPGWSIRMISGASFDFLKGNGIPLVQG